MPDDQSIPGLISYAQKKTASGEAAFMLLEFIIV